MVETLNGTRTLVRPLEVRGTTGLRQWGGYIAEEFLRPLQGPQRYKTLAEMRDNDPIIGASLLAIELLIRQVEWQVQPVDDTDQAALDAAEFVRGALFEDLFPSWDTTLTEILSMLPFGWSLHEVLYKRRTGPSRDPLRHSRFADGRWGWHSWPIRAQETLLNWEFDALGNVSAMVQHDPASYRQSTIPLAKALHFRSRAFKGNPEGRSILRNAYRPWYFKKRIEEIQGIGIERDLAGLPVAWVPPELLGENLPADLLAVKTALQKMVTNIRRDEQEGILFPLVYDENGHKLYDLTLLSTGGTRQFDTRAVIEHYNREMAMSLLTDVVLLGHEAVGSFALADSKTSLLAVGIGAYLGSIAEILNTQALPPLWELNGLPLELMPRIQHGDIEHVNLAEFGGFIRELSAAGFGLEDIENDIRRRAGLPIRIEEEV